MSYRKHQNVVFQDIQETENDYWMISLVNLVIVLKNYSFLYFNPVTTKFNSAGIYSLD